ncbi:hypothetical protein ACHAW6_009841 [Cyclotella cf. meneghiniana]
MPRLPLNPFRRFRRNRQADNSTGVVELETIAVATTALGDRCGGCCHMCGCMGAKSYRKNYYEDDGSVLTADTTLSGASILSGPFRDEFSPCEDLGFMIGSAAVCLLDGFATLMNCCDGMMVTPVKKERSCFVTWGPDEVFQINELTETTQRAHKKARQVERTDDDQIGSRDMGNNQAINTSKTNVQSVHANTAWENFESQEFEVTSESVDIWKNDEPEHTDPEHSRPEQKMIEAAFVADFSDFSSFISTPEIDIEDPSVKSSSTAATGKPPCNGKQVPRSCACCGKRNKKEAPIKLKICSRCKTTYYCSAQCQKVDWHYGHKNKCRAQILL